MHIKIIYAPIFIRQFKKLDADLQDEIIHKIELFRDAKNHKALNVHKLKGRLKKSYSFSIDYKNRIVFDRLSSDEVAFLDVGDHNIHK